VKKAINTTFHKRTLFLAKQIQIYIKDLDFAAYDDNGKSKSTR
jgi:hypothetical protein